MTAQQLAAEIRERQFWKEYLDCRDEGSTASEIMEAFRLQMYLEGQ